MHDKHVCIVENSYEYHLSTEHQSYYFAKNELNTIVSFLCIYWVVKSVWICVNERILTGGKNSEKWRYLLLSSTHQSQCLLRIDLMMEDSYWQRRTAVYTESIMTVNTRWSMTGRMADGLYRSSPSSIGGLLCIIITGYNCYFFQTWNGLLWQQQFVRH